jgi:hypothetical protein
MPLAIKLELRILRQTPFDERRIYPSSAPYSADGLRTLLFDPMEAFQYLASAK